MAASYDNRSLALATQNRSPGCLAAVRSLWAFEELGIDEMKERIEQTPTCGPAVGADYTENYHAFLLRNNNKDRKVHAAFTSVTGQYIRKNKDGHLLDLPRIESLTDGIDGSTMMKPVPQPQSNSGALLELATETTQTVIGPARKSWFPGKMSDYFLADKMGLLPRIAEATHTEIMAMVNHGGSNPVRINVTGQTKEDVDEALDKLEATLDFIALVEQPVQDIVVLGTPGDIPRYRVLKVSDTERAISNLVVGNHNMAIDSTSFMISHAKLSDLNSDPEASRDFATTHETHKAPARWKDSDFPVLGSLQKESTKAKPSVWPALSTSKSEMHSKALDITPVSSRSSVSGSSLATSPKPAALPPKPRVSINDPNTKAVQDAAVKMRQANLERSNAAKGIPVKKTRKLTTLVDEKTAPRASSPTTPVLRAATLTPKKEPSISMSGTASSTLPSTRSGNRSPSPASQSSVYSTPYSSPPPTAPPLRQAMYTSRPDSPAKVPRPEFEPGTRDSLASIRYPGFSSNNNPRPSSPAVSGLHAFGQTAHDRFMLSGKARDRFILSGNVTGPSRQPFAPVPKEASRLAGLSEESEPFCLPKPRVVIQPTSIAPNPIMPNPSSSMTPPVPAAQASASSEGTSRPRTPSTVPKNINKLNGLIDVDMDDDPGPTNLTLPQEGFAVEGEQDQAVIQDVQKDAVTEDLQEQPSIGPGTEPVLSTDDPSCRRVSNPINDQCPLEIYVTDDKLVMVPCMDILREQLGVPHGIGFEETVNPDIQQTTEETVDAEQQRMAGEPADPEPQDGTLNTTHPSESSVQELLLEYLRDQVRIFSNSPSPNDPPETQDQADEPIHETLGQVSEQDTRDFHNTMNQMSARPPDHKEESKTKADAKARHKSKKNDVWGLKTIQSIQGHNNVAQTILAPALESTHGESSGSSSKHGKSKRSKSKDRSKPVFHIIEPVLSTARSFPGRLNLEIQLGIAFIPPTAPVGPMSLSDLRDYFHPQTGLPPPKSLFNNRLALRKEDLDKIINLEINERRMFDIEPFTDSLNFEFHCSFTRGRKVESFIVTIFDDEPARTTGNGLTLADIHLNFPEHVWDASLRVMGQSAHVNLPAETKEAIQDMIKGFRRIFTGSDLKVETNMPPPPFQVKQVLMKHVTKYTYLREREKSTKEDLYLKVTEIEDLIISLSGPGNRKVTACCAPADHKSTPPRRWSEASLISSSTEDALESNWKLELGSSTTKWNTATLFGHGTAPALPSVSDRPDSMIDAPGLWSLFGLTEMVVKNMDGVGYQPPTDVADTKKENTKPNNELVVSKPPAPRSSSASGSGTRDSSKSLVGTRHYSRLNEWSGDSPRRRFW